MSVYTDFARPLEPMLVSDAVAIARATTDTIRAMGWADPAEARSKAASLLVESNERLLGRLNAIIAYCADETDGDNQPHDTDLYHVTQLAMGRMTYPPLRRR